MKVLLVDDDKNSRNAMRWFLQRSMHEVTECVNGKEALEIMGSEDFPLVISDIMMPVMDGIELTSKIKSAARGWSTEVVLVTGYGDMKSAVSALRAGAFDYLQKPVDAEELDLVVDRVAEHQSLLRENRQWNLHFDEEVRQARSEARSEMEKARKLAAEELVGKVGIFSIVMHDVFTEAQSYYLDRNIPVLIEGETGTGKELVAKMIHFGDKYDPTQAGPFIDINCAAIAQTLFESELFGYEAGAFSGGLQKGQKGKFDLAQGGTLFLDEIGDMPLEVQSKLLRVLQEKEFYRVGGLKKIKTNARLICATNVDLQKKVDSGQFRRDLFFRLKVGYLHIPPLCDRKDEIGELARFFLLEAANRKKKNFTAIHPDALLLLQHYDWPGNVRELKNVIEYATFAFDGPDLLVSHIIDRVPVCENIVRVSRANELEKADEILIQFPIRGSSLNRCTDELILKMLELHQGNQSATARSLGLSVRGLTKRLKKIKDRTDETDDEQMT